MSIVTDKQTEIFKKLHACVLLDDYKKVESEFKNEYKKLKEHVESNPIVAEKGKLKQEYKESLEFMNAEFRRWKSKVFAPARWVKIETEGDGPQLYLLDCRGDFLVSDGKNLLRCPYLELIEQDGKYYLKQTEYPEREK